MPQMQSLDGSIWRPVEVWRVFKYKKTHTGVPNIMFMNRVWGERSLFYESLSQDTVNLKRLLTISVCWSWSIFSISWAERWQRWWLGLLLYRGRRSVASSLSQYLSNKYFFIKTLPDQKCPTILTNANVTGGVRRLQQLLSRVDQMLERTAQPRETTFQRARCPRTGQLLFILVNWLLIEVWGKVNQFWFSLAFGLVSNHAKLYYFSMVLDYLFIVVNLRVCMQLQKENIFPF